MEKNQSESKLNAADDDTALETAAASQDEAVVRMPISQGTLINKNAAAAAGDFKIQPVETDGFEDIGRYIQAEMSTKKVGDAVRALSRGKKHAILPKHFLPPAHYKFSGTYENGCLRSFRYKYFKNRPWLKHSPHLDDTFCVPCALFVNDRSNKQSLVTKPFKKWARYTSVVVEDAEKTYHRDAMIAAQAFKESVENPSNTVACLFDKEREKRIKENRQIVKSIARPVLFCGRQCIALRGHRPEKVDQSENPGNFLTLLKVFFRGRSNFGSTFTD